MSGCSHILGLLTAAGIMLLAVQPSFAEEKKEKKGTWNGDFSLSAGTNFRTPEKDEVGEVYSKKYTRTFSEGSALLGYKGKKFSLEGRLDASTFVYLTGGLGITAQGSDGVIDQAHGDVTIQETNESTYKGGLSGSWEINPKNMLEFYYNASIARNIPRKGVITADSLLVPQINFKYGYTSEDVNETTVCHGMGVHYRHLFEKKGREFNVSMDMSFQKDDKYTQWNLGDGDAQKSSVEKTYRETPVYYDNFVSINAKYSDLNFLGVKKLLMEFIVDSRITEDRDNLSAANYIGGMWIDSTSFRESFDFFQFFPRPGIRAAYSKGIFSIDAKYQPEIYSYLLSGDYVEGTKTFGSVAHFVDANTSLSPGKGHTVTLNFKRDVTRPDYIQMCWFDRGGTYANEIIRGNPDLKPSTKARTSLVYEFKHKRFSTALDLGYTYQFNQIESTFYSEEHNGMTYRINTWINSSKNVTGNAGLVVSWRGKYLEADLGGNYNYYVGWKDSGTETAEADYSLFGNISYALKSWLFKGKVRYQSEVIRNYTSTTEIIGLDARVEKKFKRFGIFLEGRDLLDKAIETYTISDDETEGRLEVDNKNRRAFILGLSYSF